MHSHVDVALWRPRQLAQSVEQWFWTPASLPDHHETPDAPRRFLQRSDWRPVIFFLFCLCTPSEMSGLVVSVTEAVR